MKLALMLISSWLVASVPISIVLGKALKRLDLPMPPRCQGTPRSGTRPSRSRQIGGWTPRPGGDRLLSGHFPSHSGQPQGPRKVAASSGRRGGRRKPVS
jgi:hypothetical protein